MNEHLQRIINDVDQRLERYRAGVTHDSPSDKMTIDIRASRELQIAAFAYREGSNDSRDQCGCEDCYTG